MTGQHGNQQADQNPTREVADALCGHAPDRARCGQFLDRLEQDKENIDRRA